MAGRDFIRAKRHGAFGTRLRRLSEALDRQVQAIYRAHDSGFEPRWFPIITALSECGPLSVGELATLIGITHVAVSQVSSELKRAGLIRVTTDPNDRRRQVLELSAKGRAGIERLQPLWRALARATEELCAKEAPHLLAELDSLEEAIARKPLPERVRAIMDASRKSSTKEKPNVRA